MSEENRFNLVDEPWIPIVGEGLVSLRAVFSQTKYGGLGGTPVHKVAMTKLLLAIAQTAYSPEDDEDWAKLKPSGLAKKCLTYLNERHDSFYLYGVKPFLQMPAIKAAAIQRFGAVLAEVSTGNTTVLTQSQKERNLSDADKALLIVQLMGFGLGGKKTDNSVVLSQGYRGKFNDKNRPSSGKPGTSLGFLGFLHNFLQGGSLLETLWLNLLSKQQISDLGIYTSGIGRAPWDQMPTGEDCSSANILKKSLMGRLIPLSRFCLLADDGLHYSEGIAHPGYKDGGVDPSVSVNFTAKDIKAIWVDPEKRPWRLLTALLSFLSPVGSKGFDCHQLRLTLQRALREVTYPLTLGVWSGGLRVSNNAGEQFVSGTDDFVESVVLLDRSILGGQWFTNLQLEMEELDKLSKIVFSATVGYQKSQKIDNRDRAAQVSNLFWQFCERQFQALLDACGDADEVCAMRPIFAQFAEKAYDSFCYSDTARQLDAWAENRPNLGVYLKQTSKKEVA